MVFSPQTLPGSRRLPGADGRHDRRRPAVRGSHAPRQPVRRCSRI